MDDLRSHQKKASSRFFEMGLSVPEVALISGHRDPRMLFRYTHLRAEDVSAKLRQVHEEQIQGWHEHEGPSGDR